MLTEPWGLIYRIMVYSGQGHDISNNLSHTEFVVHYLMSGLFYKGWSLFMDNYNNSVNLSKQLLLEKKPMSQEHYDPTANTILRK